MTQKTNSRSTTRERDRIIRAACDEGRFAASRMEHYRRLWDDDPDSARTLLTADERHGGLARGPRPAVGQSRQHADPLRDDLGAGEAALLEASRARMRNDLAGARDAMASAPQTVSASESRDLGYGRYELGAGVAAAEPSTSPAAELTVEGSHLSYGGLPVSIAEDGTPRVHTSVGAVSVQTLATLDLNLDEERLLHASRVRMRSAA